MSRSLLLAGLAVALAITGCKKTVEPPGGQPGGEQPPQGKPIDPAFTLKTPYAGKLGDGILRVSLSANGESLVVSGYTKDKNVQSWDLRTRKPVGHFSTGYHGPYAILTPDGSRIVSTWKFDRLLICDPRGGENKGELEIPRSDADLGSVIRDLRVSADGSLATVITFQRVMAWDITGRKLRFERPAPGSEFSSLSPLFAEGKRFATGHAKGEILIWEVDQSKPVQALTMLEPKEVESVVVTADGAYLAARSGHSGATSVRVWDLRSGQVVHEFDKKGFAIGGSVIRFLPDNKTLLYGDDQNALVLFDVSTKTPRYRNAGIPGDTGHRIWSIDVTPDGATLAVGYEDGVVKVFDLKSLP